MPTQSQRRLETRARLMEAARTIFVRDGFEGASMEAVLSEASASKGALYHHFEGKLDLFAAVFEAVSREAIAQPRPRARGTPESRFADACFQWLKAIEAPDIRAILIDLGPRVLGFARAREIEDANSLDAMRAGAYAMGASRSKSTDMAIRLLNSGLGELALMRARDGAPSDREARRLIGALIRGLFAKDS